MQLNEFNINQDHSNKTSYTQFNIYDNNPGNAISARFDLSTNLFFKKNVGAIDAKITSYYLARNEQTLAISGPTYQNQQPF